MSSFSFDNPASTDIYTLSLHDALPICGTEALRFRLSLVEKSVHRTGGANGSPSNLLGNPFIRSVAWRPGMGRSEEHTSELQSQSNLVCRLLLEKKKTNHISQKSMN